MELNELTKSEEEIMKVLWELEKGFVKEVMVRLPEPKPAYTSVSTVIRILERKGFVSYEVFGNTHRYFPLIRIEEYKRFAVEKLLKGYFGNSVTNMLHFLAMENDPDLRES